jgi:hypothetical protein
MIRLGILLAFILILFSCSNNPNHSKKKINDNWVESNFVDETVFNGLTKFYNDKNVLQKTDYYVHGIRNGPSLNYHSNGKIYDSINYINGFKNGYRFVYDSAGQLGYKEYYFMSRKLGPEISIHDNVISRYDFTDFDRHDLYSYVSESLDSAIRRKGELFYWTPYQTYDGDTLNNYVFVYLIRPPKMSITYELVARDSENKESHVAYLTNDVFADTLVSRGDDKRKFFIKANVFDSLEKGKQKLHYAELIYNQYFDE